MKRLIRLSAMATIATTLGAAGTLDNIKKVGILTCGISAGIPGFSESDPKGVWRGFDIDFCRAVAAAVLGDDTKVKYVSLKAKERSSALQSGTIDLLSGDTAWTNTRETTLGISFSGINYHDGQGFMALTALGIKSAKELDGATVCTQAGTTTEMNLADYFRSNNMKFKAITFDTKSQINKAFFMGRCDILTTNQSQLYAIRAKAKDPSKYAILPEIISKKPLGLSVRQGDTQWRNAVMWIRNALITAEEREITSKNVADAAKNSAIPEVRRLLGTEGTMGANVGLDASAYMRAIAQVGNYGEIFETNLGKNTPLKIERGFNRLWSKGGILYSPPFR